MANPNPSPGTRFGPDRLGRAKQKGARDRLSATFLKALADDFEAHGKDVVVKVREEDPSAYLRVVASLAPKEMEISRPMDAISDDMLDMVIAAVTAALNGDNAPADQPTVMS